MISIEKVLLKRFILIALVLIVTLASFHSWWTESLYLKMQKQQLQHEGSALAQHLRRSSPKQLTSLTLNLPQHSSHMYVIRSQIGSWSSAPEVVGGYPLDNWFNVPGFYEFEDSSNRSFLILSQILSDSVQFIVIQESTAALTELEKNHNYMLFVIFLALTIILLLQQKVIRDTFSILDPIKSQIDAVQRGEKPTLPDSDISEISSLVSAINQLLGYLHSRTERSKNAVGNLSHALKTPIAVITQIAETKNNGLTSEARDLLLEQADQLNLIITSELKRARISGRGYQSKSFSIENAVVSLAATLKLIYPEKPLTFDINIDPQAYFPGEQSDFTELIGNLMDNAAKWCDGNIKIDINKIEDQFIMVVTDNGPGCSQHQIERLTKRGLRLDEQTKGSGLGLNIVQTIVEQYQGNIRFYNREQEGFSVTVQIPQGFF